MKQIIFSAAAILAVSFSACTNQNNGEAPAQADTTVNKNENDMKNLISIVEIPTADFARAVVFYQVILDIKIEQTEMGGITMGAFPTSGDGVFVQLIKGDDYKPSADGTIVYLNGGDDLQKVAGRVEANGGKIVVPKTEIGPDMGFFAIFTDTEGNKVGLHSPN
jgi:predicted enzyme related to lactoylglutathione lyase